MPVRVRDEREAHQVRRYDGPSAVGVGVAQLDDQLFHGLSPADVLGGVGHIDLHVLGELVDQQVPLVPQFQGVVAVDLVLADGGVQIPDVGEDAVDLGNVSPRPSILMLWPFRQRTKSCGSISVLVSTTSVVR